MKVGISTASLFPERHTEEALATIGSLGADTAEVFFSTFYEYRPEFSKELAHKAAGISVNSVHAMPLNFEPNFFNPTRRVQGDGFYWLDQLARSAQLLGCKNYTFHGFPRSGGEESDDLGFIGFALDKISRFCAGYGLNLCLENTAHYAYNRPGFFSAVKEKAPLLLGVFDVKQARRSGYPWQMYIEDMAGSIAYAHLSDVTEQGAVCLPGEGIYDFKEMLRRMKGVGFDGDLIIEVYRGDFGDVEELRNSYEYLCEIVENVK